MPEESAVLDVPETESTEEVPDELQEFHYESYVQYFPEQYRDVLTAILSQKKYGWIKRARLLQKISNVDAYMQTLHQRLADMCGERKARTLTVIAPNAGLRAWLVSRSNDVLRDLSAQYGVSYTSFMPEGAEDRTTLIEALLDEMMSTE